MAFIQPIGFPPRPGTPGSPFTGNLRVSPSQIPGQISGTQQSAENYISMIRRLASASPGYIEMAKALRLPVANALAMAREEAPLALLRSGIPGLANLTGQLWEGTDIAGLSASAAANPYSLWQQLQNQYNLSWDQALGNLGARGLARSGDVGFAQKQIGGQLELGQSQVKENFYDLIRRLLGGVTGAESTAGMETAREFAAEIRRQSELNPLSPPPPPLIAPRQAPQTIRTLGLPSPFAVPGYGKHLVL